MPDPANEQEYREEAERLALAPKEDQAAAVAWLRDIAADPRVRKADRDAAARRAKALARLLKLAKKRPKNDLH